MNPVEDLVWLACDECGYGTMFMTNGVAELPVHLCGTRTFLPPCYVEDDEEYEDEE